MMQTIIVGAGPTGATLALLLAQRGVSVTLVEAAPDSQRLLRGEALMPSGLTALAQMGWRSLSTAIPTQILGAWEVVVENRSLFRVAEPLEPDGQSCTLISQAALLQTLIAQAAQYPNFTWAVGSPVQNLLWAEGRVAGVKLANQQEIGAALVIGCDGRQSVVRKQAKLSLEQQPVGFDILWFTLPDLPDMPNTFYSFVRDRHTFGLFRSVTGQLQIGWSLYADDPLDWKTADWPTLLAAAAPPWLAAHIQAQASSLSKPSRLPIIVGRCPRWYTPGLLLLGDAAHPLSPIRAQGINMALRDAIVAANSLVPVLQGHAPLSAIDVLLPQIQAEREPEIIQIQVLQAAEMAQAQMLRNSPILRYAVRMLAPIIGHKVQKSWLNRQQTLRRGFTQVNLEV